MEDPRPAATPASVFEAVLAGETVDLGRSPGLLFRDPSRRPWARLVARGLIQLLLVGMLPAEWQVRVALWPAFALLAAERLEKRLTAPASALLRSDPQLGHCQIWETPQPLVRAEEHIGTLKDSGREMKGIGGPETVSCADLRRSLDNAGSQIDDQEIPGSEDGIEARQGIEILHADGLYPTLQPRQVGGDDDTIGRCLTTIDPVQNLRPNMARPLDAVDEGVGVQIEPHYSPQEARSSSICCSMSAALRVPGGSWRRSSESLGTEDSASRRTRTSAPLASVGAGVSSSTVFGPTTCPRTTTVRDIGVSFTLILLASSSNGAAVAYSGSGAPFALLRPTATAEDRLWRPAVGAPGAPGGEKEEGEDGVSSSAQPRRTASKNWPAGLPARSTGHGGGLGQVGCRSGHGWLSAESRVTCTCTAPAARGEDGPGRGRPSLTKPIDLAFPVPDFTKVPEAERPPADKPEDAYYYVVRRLAGPCADGSDTCAAADRKVLFQTIDHAFMECPEGKIYEDGVLKPKEPLSLAEHGEVEVLVLKPLARDPDDPTGWKAIDRLIGAAKGEPSDASARHDEYLHKDPHE